LFLEAELALRVGLTPDMELLNVQHLKCRPNPNAPEIKRQTTEPVKNGFLAPQTAWIHDRDEVPTNGNRNTFNSTSRSY
jgi:hypothetical protein